MRTQKALTVFLVAQACRSLSLKQIAGVIYQNDIRKNLQAEDGKALPLRTDSSASLISKFQDGVLTIEASEAVLSQLQD